MVKLKRVFNELAIILAVVKVKLKRVFNALAVILAVVAVLAIIAGCFIGMSYLIEIWFEEYAVLAALVFASVLTLICSIVALSLTSTSSRADLEQELLHCKNEISNYEKKLSSNDERHAKEISSFNNKIKDLENNLKLARQHEDEIKTKYENLEKTRDIQQKQIFDEQELNKRLEKDFKGAIEKYNQQLVENARITDQNILYAELFDGIIKYLDTHSHLEGARKILVDIDSEKCALLLANAG